VASASHTLESALAYVGHQSGVPVTTTVVLSSLLVEATRKRFGKP